MMPAFVDSHIHIDGVGELINTLDLRGVQSIEEMKKLIKSFAEATSARYIVARGWDQELFAECRWPTRRDLDEAVADRPVIAVRVCGHAAVLNSTALKALNLDEVFGQSPVFDPDSGLVKEKALEFVRERIYEMRDVDEVAKFIDDAQRKLLSEGVAAVGFMSISPKVFAALMRLRIEGRLKLRVASYISYDFFKRISQMPISIRDEVLWIQGVKLFVDGSLGARTALLSEPYSDAPATRGQQIMSVEELSEAMLKASSLGLQMAVHAIGDGALDVVIKASEVSGVRGWKLLRVEHASVVRDDQLDSIRNAGFGISVQPHFILSDWWVVKRVGVSRAKWVYRFKTLSRITLTAFSTDAPVEPSNPWETVYAATTRGRYEGLELYEYTADEALSVSESLDMYTRSAAKLIGLDDGGTLEIGHRLDAIIVDRDPLLPEIEDLRKIRVLKTYVNGAELYSF